VLIAAREFVFVLLRISGHDPSDTITGSRAFPLNLFESPAGPNKDSWHDLDDWRSIFAWLWLYRRTWSYGSQVRPLPNRESRICQRRANVEGTATDEL